MTGFCLIGFCKEARQTLLVKFTVNKALLFHYLFAQQFLFYAYLFVSVANLDILHLNLNVFDLLR